MVGRQFQQRVRLALHCGRTSRRGITLLEVVLALAIFIAAFAMISQILTNGSRTATKAQLTSEAVFRCEQQLNAMLAGVEPLQSVSGTPFEDDPQWVWTANVLDAGVANLLHVEMTVEHRREVDGVANVSFTLTRMIRDPQLFYDAALESTGGL